MSHPKSVGSKVRTLYSDTLVEADGNFPAFPSGPTDGVMAYKGDFKGADIVGFEYTCGALTTITALDATVEHSHDGSNWHTLKALTQATGASVTQMDLDDGDPEPFRYLRVVIAKTGTYGSAAGVKVKVIFSQPRPRGTLSGPGRVDANG